MFGISPAGDNHRVDVLQIALRHNQMIQKWNIRKLPAAFQFGEVVEKAELIVGEFPRPTGHGDASGA